ncbi:hypothetical protein GLYMA_07G122100v4 [Glycine max]|uniref:ATP-dependent DNA helicase n=1 Tax=Glycine max TaxID=3847 RepID=A0A0R0J2P1_SOYBN|nr:hypothetical protein GLYMA_07G122100v4 [Glycine max]
MTNRYVLESLDRSLKYILDCYAPFRGKVMVLGGNFRQVLPAIKKGGLPLHILKVKKDPKSNLCNGTRLLCHGFFMNMLDVEILSGHHAGRKTFLLRIKHKTTESVRLPFTLLRNHSQLYVALSRGVFQASTKILIKEGKFEGEDENFIKNVVFKEILISQT